MSLTLLYQTHSPYARKALVFAHEAGLAERIEVVHHETSPTLRNEAVFSRNPLCKVPVLIREDGGALFDSDVICAYLDTLHAGAPLIPAKGERRWQALALQSMAQGLADAGIAIRWEAVRRPEHLRYPPLRDGYIDKLLSSYAWLDDVLHPDDEIDIGRIALATTLSWLEFRGLPSFRDHARLCLWFDRFEARASMRATPLSGETHDA